MPPSSILRFAGSNIWSTSMSGGYETMSGTSMATPMVSVRAAGFAGVGVRGNLRGAGPKQAAGWARRVRRDA